jgi:hypothetical protein
MHQKLKQDQRRNEPMENDLGAGIAGGGRWLRTLKMLSRGALAKDWLRRDYRQVKF